LPADRPALPVDGPGYDRWASLLHTGAVLWGAESWWPLVPETDVRTPLWTRLAGGPGGSRSEAVAPRSTGGPGDGRGMLPAGPRPALRPSLFADAGMALLRDQEPRPAELWSRR